MRMPQYQRAGWRPNGPGRCICPACRQTVSTNALARASHARACAKRKNEKPEITIQKETAR